MKFTTFGTGAVLTLFLVGGCDPSKEEFEKIRSERDQLKAQLGTMQTSMDAVKKELADAKAQAAKCQPAAAPSAAGAPAAPTDPAKAAAAAKPTPPAKH